MQFNDTALEQGICQEIDDICDTTISSYSLAKKTRRCNVALLDLELQALMASGTWQFDDSNYTSNPTGLLTMVSGTQEYAFDSTLLNVEKVEVLLIDGVSWQILNPVDENDYNGTQLAQTGIPTMYYKRGKFIGLIQIPATGKVTLANGLRVTFSRTGSLFVASDTTKEPGIISTFHITIAKKAALPYCRIYKKDRVPSLLAEIAADERKFEKYYASRSRDESPVGTMRRVSGR